MDSERTAVRLSHVYFSANQIDRHNEIIALGTYPIQRGTRYEQGIFE